MPQISLTHQLEVNQILLQSTFSDCTDIVYRKIKADLGYSYVDILLVFTEGLVDSERINDNIIKPLHQIQCKEDSPLHSQPVNMERIKEIITINNIEEARDLKDIVNGILSGDTILIMDGLDLGLVLNTKGWAKRSVEEPSVESVIRGSREGLTESIRDNTALIRRKLKDPNLKIKEHKIGSRTQTNVFVLYIEDVVNPQLLKDISEKLEEIAIDGVFESGYIEQYLEAHPYSPFPQMQITERPDKICGNLLEGRIVILVDGAPQALILPVTFFQLFQSPEDYNERVIYGNLTRLLRFAGFFIATSFPSIYVAFISFHQQMLPADLILDLSRTRAQVPFPPVVEALLMEVIIELLREASARLPGTIGQTIGIVGAIVIGDAAVRANLASPAMVIVVATTAIGSYVLPHYSTTYPLRLIRFPMVFMAATFGAFGIIITWSWIIIHLCSIDSFGYPYLSPLAPLDTDLKKDAILRKSLWNMRVRPRSSSKKNQYRW